MAVTQDALYRDIDLELSWSEGALPQRERTKHVHGLHPYLGKFIPQLVEALLARYFRPGQRVLDPFAGSGTTLVQALESGLSASGADIAAFNVLLTRVKTATYDLFRLERDVRDALAQPPGEPCAPPTPYMQAWYTPQAAGELLAFAGLVDRYRHADVLKVILARAARSARRTTHFRLDFPTEPQLEPYWCHKHRRICRPVDRAWPFLVRYAEDTLARIKAFARVRRRECSARVVHGDSRRLRFKGPLDGIVTSPPYPGLIDYHEQHRYAYELLDLDDRRERELGAAASGTGKPALDSYTSGIAAVLRNAASALAPGAPVVIVIGDRRDLYPGILERAGLHLEERYRRHVNRRTGRRAGEFFEDVLVARAS